MTAKTAPLSDDESSFEDTFYDAEGIDEVYMDLAALNSESYPELIVRPLRRVKKIEAQIVNLKKIDRENYIHRESDVDSLNVAVYGEEYLSAHHSNDAISVSQFPENLNEIRELINLYSNRPFNRRYERSDSYSSNEFAA